MSATKLEDLKKEAAAIGAPINDNWGVPKVQAAIEKRKKELAEEEAPAPEKTPDPEPVPTETVTVTPDVAPEPTVTPEPAEQAAPEPITGVTIRNTTAAPITLIANRQPGGRVTILPTKTEVVTGKFMKEIEANKGAMTFFTTGELVRL